MKHSLPRVMLFDVNETLLDAAPLKQNIGDLLQDPSAGKLWFTTMLQYSLVMTVGGQYAGLPEIGTATLQMLARNSEVTLSPDEAKEIVGGMRTLAPHPEVAAALERLKKSGVRLATLTNSSQDGAKAQLQHARLDGFFERQLSVDSLKKFKPHSSVYEWACTQMGVPPAECMLVAAHGWDVAGAKWAGLLSAFIARKEQQKFQLAPAPDIDVADLEALANELGV
jgi:2-haloacid dehalogenase